MTSTRPRRPRLATALLFLLALILAGGLPVAPALAETGPAMAADSDYRLGPGDKVRVIVFGEDSLSGEFLVSDGGTIAFPLVGEIDVRNRTVAQFQTDMLALLRDGYFTDPRVSVEVLNYRPFFILGEVNKPGTYPYTSGLTVFNAVATANGFTYRANTRKVFIKRADQAREEEVPLTSTVVVQPGDTIRIAERFF
jgi:protein involved in polysaccharide export with SLBB domain